MPLLDILVVLALVLPDGYLAVVGARHGVLGGLRRERGKVIHEGDVALFVLDGGLFVLALELGDPDED